MHSIHCEKNAQFMKNSIEKLIFRVLLVLKIQSEVKGLKMQPHEMKCQMFVPSRLTVKSCSGRLEKKFAASLKSHMQSC